MFLLLLGSPRWLLSFAFALRSPHSALVLQQAFGGILLAALTLTFVELQEALCATIHHPPGYRSTIQRLCLFVPCSADIIIQDRSIATLLSAAAPSPSGCFVTTKPRFLVQPYHHTRFRIQSLHIYPAASGSNRSWYLSCLIVFLHQKNLEPNHHHPALRSGALSLAFTRSSLVVFYLSILSAFNGWPRWWTSSKEVSYI